MQYLTNNVFKITYYQIFGKIKSYTGKNCVSFFRHDNSSRSYSERMTQHSISIIHNQLVSE